MRIDKKHKANRAKRDHTIPSRIISRGPISHRMGMLILTLLTLSLVSLPGFSVMEWEIMLSIQPTSENLNAIWGTSEDAIFVVGEFGTILYYDGSSWAKMDSGTEARLYGVWGSNENDVFAVGEDALVLHYNGDTWTEMTKDLLNHDLRDVWGSSSDDVYAVAFSGILHFDGSLWSVVPNTNPLGEAIWGTSGDDVHVVGYGPALHYDGNTWTKKGGLHDFFYYQYAIWGTADDGFYVVGNLEATYHFDSVSDTWIRLTNIPRSKWYGLWGTSGSDLFAVGELGTIARYSNSTWASMTSDTETDLNDVWGSSETNVYAVGDNGTILLYNGSAWSPVSSGWSNGLSSVSGNATDNVYAVGSGGTFLHYDGSVWTEDPFGASVGGVVSVWVDRAGEVFVGGFDGGGHAAVHHKEGSGWTTDTVAGYGVTLWDLWGNAPDDIFAVGDIGTIVHYDGTNWTQMTSGTTESFRAIWGSAGDDVFAVTLGSVFHYDGSSWQDVTTGWPYPFLDVWGSAPDDVFASSVCNLLLYDGDSWMPEQVESSREVFLFGIWGSAGDDVFAVGDAGFVYHYNGTISSIAQRLTSKDLFGAWGSPTGDVFAVGATGTILFCEGCARATGELRLGDLDGDGTTTVVDVRLCLQIAVGAIPGTAEQRQRADFDDDGDVDLDDAQILAEFVIGIRTTLP